MIRLGRILKENIDQHKRKVYLKAAIEMATAYSRRGYTQDEAIKDAAQGVKNVHGYVLTPQDIEAVKHFVPVNPQFKEIVVKPTSPTPLDKYYSISDRTYDDFIDMEYLQDIFDDVYNGSAYKGNYNYESGEFLNAPYPEYDYEWVVGMGDDFPHGITINNPRMVKDPKIKEFIRSIRGKSSIGENLEEIVVKPSGDPFREDDEDEN
jgi:hypothetical protein